MNERWDIRAFLLDMDGTLLDTETVYFEALRAAMEALGSTDDPVALFRTMIGVPGPRCEAMLLERYGRDFPLAQFNAVFNARCMEVLEAGLPLKRGVVELLDALREAGPPYAIVTSTSRRTAEKHLTLAGIRTRFDVIVTGSDITHGKPHPEPYLLGAERLGAKPVHCLAVEDSGPGIASAHAAGAITVMVPDIVPPTPETRDKCAAVLPDLHALLALLREKGTLG
ncbi:MAG: HAD family phosphatase [Bradyrhizobium sp.]|uniref:HAD family hydrolase n=1 Tax=Bradyrhizobium sp. TaxID=376 RepID=UPI001DDD2253|nr:HAD family phosphatase [Bradyrhizobium sp.]MBV9561799.1 HAD family phosphatase [Bradyrhizobium sp.]